MPKATWRGKVIAESDRFETVEGNIYFPPESVKPEHVRPSQTTSLCPWKGTASYYTVVVDDQENPDAAWYYPETKEAAQSIRGMVAFWKGVEVTE